MFSVLTTPPEKPESVRLDKSTNRCVHRGSSTEFTERVTCPVPSKKERGNKDGEGPRDEIWRYNGNMAQIMVLRRFVETFFHIG